MINRPYIGTKTPGFIDADGSELPITPGIYKGIVKKLDSTTRTGRLWVYIAELGGNDPDVTNNWTLVSYASPFTGYTSGPAGVSTKNDFTHTHQTYGMSMIVPDVGSQVLCGFPEGERQEGYWFACINPNASQYMIPAIGSVPLSLIDPASIPATLMPYMNSTSLYPVGEANKNAPATYDGVPLRPLHVPQTVNLIKQGLINDPVRGTITSSLQRDAVPSVFGISTPGRPYGNADPAVNPQLAEQLKTGNYDPADVDTSGTPTRTSGHSLVMDDGDLYGDNNLVRLRTAAGHQLIMHDTEGIVYLCNAAGTAWVELTKAGDVLVYSDSDIAMRAAGSIQLQADKDINLNAGGSINAFAGASINLESTAINVNSTGDLNLAGAQAQIKSAAALGVIAGADLIVNGGGKLTLDGATVAIKGGAPGDPLEAPKEIKKSASGGINSTVPTAEPYARAAGSRTLNTVFRDVNGNTVTLPRVRGVGSNKGALAAGSTAVKRTASDAYFIRQPDPGQGLGVLNKDQLRAYFAQIAYTESGHQYNIENQFGYQGKYQFGAGALKDQNYIKSSTKQSVADLNNPNNWLGKDGTNSAADFRNNPTLQEKVMYEYTKRNYAALQNMGLITATTSADIAAGLLSASHLVGPGGAAKWYRDGISQSDANGTTAEAYFNQGRYSQTKVDVIAASNDSKTTTG